MQKIAKIREKSQKLEYGAILNFVVKCSINLEINKTLQLDLNNTWKELEGEMIRNKTFKGGGGGGGRKVKTSWKTRIKSIQIHLQLRSHFMVELNFSAIIAEELHIYQSG